MMTGTEWVYFGSAVSASLVGLILLFKSTHKKQEPTYPRPLDTFFEEGKCPNCGQGSGFYTWQDGGHDTVLECPSCQSVYGINYPPLQLIEQIGGRVTKDVSHANEDDPRAIRRGT